MTEIRIRVSGADAVRVEKVGKLTTGMVGAVARYSFDGVWDGLQKTAVFRGSGVTRDVVQWDGDAVRIPAKVLRQEGQLYIGVEGRDAEGTVVVPTVWVDGGKVLAGANASGDPSTDPELEVWAQIQAMIGDLAALGTVDKTTLVAAINEALQSGGGGTVDEEAVTRLVDEYLAEVSPEEIGAIPAPTTAQVGQTIVVTELDEGGRPVSWECVDVVSDWRELRTIAIPEDVSADTSGVTWTTNDSGAVLQVAFDTDGAGESFAASELMIFANMGTATANYFGVSDQHSTGVSGYGNLACYRITQTTLTEMVIHIMTVGSNVYGDWSVHGTGNKPGSVHVGRSRVEGPITKILIGTFSNAAGFLVGSELRVFAR